MKDIQHICIAKLDEHYIGFDVMSVRSVYEVNELLPIPMKLPNILGVFNRRGKVLSVVDSLRFCALQMGDKSKNYHTLLHLEFNGDECCFTMDSVEEVKEVAVENLRDPPSSLNSALKKFCQAICIDKNRMIMILDFQKMFAELSQTR